MSLPQKLPLELMQTRWASEIDPVLKFPPVQGILIKGVALKTGVNVINNLLSRMQQGYVIIDQDGPASIYRSQPLSSSTLTLTASAPCTIAIWMF